MEGHFGDEKRRGRAETKRLGTEGGEGRPGEGEGTTCGCGEREEGEEEERSRMERAEDMDDPKRTGG